MPHFAFPRSSPSCRNCRLAPLKKRRAADCLATEGGARPTPKSRMHLALLARVFHPPCANAARPPARPRVRPTSSHTTGEPCRFRDATYLPLTHPRHHLSSPFAFFICPSSLLSLSPTTPRSARSLRAVTLPYRHHLSAERTRAALPRDVCNPHSAPGRLWPFDSFRDVASRSTAL